MNIKQKALRTKWGMASNDYQALETAYDYIPKKYKRHKRMIKHTMEKLEKKMKESEKKFTYMGD